jgi:hypothetical protein
MRITAHAGLIARLTLYLIIAGAVSGLHSYSVLSHEALIDSAWDANIKPLLVKRFPKATPDELREAHGYTYGGAIIQDLGYYPPGSHYFSDLTHYVRSGDFIAALIRDARDLNEYAFALGSLAHYAADNQGHSIAVNRVVPMLYPKVPRTDCCVATYEDSPAAHMKAEFGFDVLEVAKGRYAAKEYHDFIGFGVSKELLERAFEEIYSLPLRSVFPDFDRAVGNYRHAVLGLIPKATKIAWELKKDDIQKSTPGITRDKFLYNLSRASYENEWGTNYDKPGFGSKVWAFVFRIIPKIGPFKALAFHAPTPEAEKLFMESFNAALTEYKQLLSEAGARRLKLPNRNFDTGEISKPGTYLMEDNAYAHLLHDLAGGGFYGVSPELRAEILEHFNGFDFQLHRPGRKIKDKHVEWAKVPAQLDELQQIPASSVAAVRSGRGVDQPQSTRETVVPNSRQ